MAQIQVSSLGIEDLLEKLRRGEWQVPQFQREFVWNIADVENLAWSIFSARPIGMVTLWEQPPNSGLELENVSLADSGSSGLIYFREGGGNGGSPEPLVRNAILDGRQRSTAIAMVFGGLRPKNNQRRFAGRFFLSLNEDDMSSPITFKKTADISRMNLDSDVGALSKGYVPLEVASGGSLFKQWTDYVAKFTDPAIYPDGTLPDPEILESRKQRLWESFEGLNNTKLAVYTVPPNYDLGDICQIFETLNTTGTKVSAVDLIHSWIYADTQPSEGGPLRLREWIDLLGEQGGAVGWASKDRRPELTVQIVTACHVASETPPEPRAIAGKSSSIKSVKQNDLLSIPTEWWRQVMELDKTKFLAEALLDFQTVVAGGQFSVESAPYPASAAIYVALRWHKEHDKADWTIGQLNSAYLAFYWQNALGTRYDQGFLTQVGADIAELKAALTDGVNLDPAAWKNAMQKRINGLINKQLPDEDYLIEQLTDGTVKGAMRDALRLRMMVGCRSDLLEPDRSISFPDASDVDMHHVFPKNWCNNNRVGDLKQRLDEKKDSGRDWLNSPANLMPLSTKSNQEWKAKSPRQALSESEITKFADRETEFRSVFIDADAFKVLIESKPETVGKLWDRRAKKMAEDLLPLMTVEEPETQV